MFAYTALDKLEDTDMKGAKGTPLFPFEKTFH